MAVFTLKRGDTLPVLEVELLNPDGTPHDLSGKTVVLRIHLSTGKSYATKLERTMTVQDAEGGVARYAWQPSDWDEGNLEAGPLPPLNPGEVEHRMEYEAISGSGRISFPSDSFDTLRIFPDIDGG